MYFLFFSLFAVSYVYETHYVYRGTYIATISLVILGTGYKKSTRNDISLTRRAGKPERS